MWQNTYKPGSVLDKQELVIYLGRIITYRLKRMLGRYEGIHCEFPRKSTSLQRVGFTPSICRHIEL